MIQHPKDIGDRSTLAAMLALGEAGWKVLMPFGENVRYDLAIERDGRLHRVQCKTGRLVKGAVIFKTASSYYHHPHPKMPAKHYQGQVDYFAVFCAETGFVYLVPMTDVPPLTAASLRVDPTRNNQRNGVRWAADYAIGRVTIEGLRGPSGA